MSITMHDHPVYLALIQFGLWLLKVIIIAFVVMTLVDWGHRRQRLKLTKVSGVRRTDQPKRRGL